MEQENTKAVIVGGYSYEPETLDRIKQVMSNIQEKISTIESGYLSICGDVAYLYDTQAWKASGHKNIYELCEARFGMSRGTVQNLRSIYENFGDGNYHLSESIQDKKITDLLKEIKKIKKLAAEVAAAEGQAREQLIQGAGSDPESEAPPKEKRKQLMKIEITTESSDWSKEELAGELVKRMGDLSIGSDFTFQLIITG
jgi:hypothetical protein